MRMKIVAAALFASTAFAAPAFAQEDAPFTGPRAEGVVGWDRFSDSAANGGSRDGVVYGGQVGFDFQAGGAVIGIEGEATGSTTKASERNVLVAGDELRASAGRDLYVGGRIGFAAGSRTLIYAKGGYTNARFDGRYTTGTTTVSDHDTADGWRLGAGAEFKLGGNLYAKAEYRYSRYDDDNSGIDAKRHQVVGGVGVRF